MLFKSLLHEEVSLKKMDVLPSGSIFHELKVVHDTGYFDGKVSPEERWQQVSQNLNTLFRKLKLERNLLNYILIRKYNMVRLRKLNGYS